MAVGVLNNKSEHVMRELGSMVLCQSAQATVEGRAHINLFMSAMSCLFRKAIARR